MMQHKKPHTLSTTLTSSLAHHVQGFILSCAAGSLRVCHLPYRERLDTPWAMRKVRHKMH